MKIIMHGMNNCFKCKEMASLLRIVGAKYTYILDKPTKDRPYPYITLELSYEEARELAELGMIK